MNSNEMPLPPPGRKNGPGTVSWVFGFLSLVPILGVLFAVVAVTLGILKWKRGGWKVVLLGAAGLLLSGAVTGLVVYRYFHPGSMASEKVYRKVTEDQLAACVKALEYYRQTEGRYPADLKTLEAKNRDLVLFDLMAMDNWKDVQYFMYDLSLSGDTYTLFARGKDKTAYTEDDILPLIPEQDLGKIGYRARPSDLASFVVSPVPDTAVPVPAEAAPASIVWVHPGEEDAEAKRRGKPVLYDFTAAWCPPCRKLNAEFFENEERAKRIAASFVTVKVMDRRREDGKNPPEVDRLQRKYGLRGFPTLVVRQKDGSTDSMVGFGGLTATTEFLEKNGMK